MSPTVVRLRERGETRCATGRMVAELDAAPPAARLITVGRGQAEEHLLRSHDLKIEIDQPTARLVLRVLPVGGGTFPTGSEFVLRLMIRSELTGQADVVFSPRVDGAGLPFVDLLEVEPSGQVGSSGAVRVSVPDRGTDLDERSPGVMPAWVQGEWAERAKTAARRILGAPALDPSLRRRTVLILDRSASVRVRADDGSVAILASLVAGVHQVCGTDDPLEVRSASWDVDSALVGPSADALAGVFAQLGSGFLLAPAIAALLANPRPARAVVITDDVPPDLEVALDGVPASRTPLVSVLMLNHSRFTPWGVSPGQTQDAVRRLSGAQPAGLHLVSAGGARADVESVLSQPAGMEALIRRLAPDLSPTDHPAGPSFSGS